MGVTLSLVLKLQGKMKIQGQIKRKLILVLVQDIYLLDSELFGQCFFRAQETCCYNDQVSFEDFFGSRNIFHLPSACSILRDQKGSQSYAAPEKAKNPTSDEALISADKK